MNYCSICCCLSCFKGGWNNNPTCREFNYIFRRQLLTCGITPAKQDNVNSTHYLIDKAPCGLVIHANESDLPLQFEDSDFDFYDHNYCQWIQPEFEVLVENIVVYIAGFVVRKIMKDCM